MQRSTPAKAGAWVAQREHVPAPAFAGARYRTRVDGITGE